MKIYTRNGDMGTTSLIGRKKYNKDAEIFEVLGTIDELNALLGLFHSYEDNVVVKQIQDIQANLFELGALIANIHTSFEDYRALGDKATELELLIDKLDDNLPELTNFILPGGCVAAVNFHLARAVCRRSERNLIFLSKKPAYKDVIAVVPYINRLSDLLFVLARYANYNKKIDELIWKSRNVK